MTKGTLVQAGGLLPRMPGSIPGGTSPPPWHPVTPSYPLFCGSGITVPAKLSKWQP